MKNFELEDISEEIILNTDQKTEMQNMKKRGYKTRID